MPRNVFMQIRVPKALGGSWGPGCPLGFDLYDSAQGEEVKLPRLLIADTLSSPVPKSEGYFDFAQYRLGGTLSEVGKGH